MHFAGLWRGRAKFVPYAEGLFTKLEDYSIVRASTFNYMLSIEQIKGDSVDIK